MQSISRDIGKTGAMKASWFLLGWAILPGWPAAAQAAQPVSISFSQATQKSVGSALVWTVMAPTGSQIVVTAKPEFLKQSKTIALKYGTPQSGSGWHESLVSPGPTSLTLNSQGVASGPLKFNISTQWSVQACYSWKPPGSDQKTEACTNLVYFQGVDPLQEGAEKMISFFFHPPSNVSAKQSGAVAVRPSGQELRLRVAKDVLMRSTSKKFRLYWDNGKILPENEKHPPGHVYFGPNPNWNGISAKVDMEGNDWGEIVVPLDFGTNSIKLNWTLKACTTIDWSGEICSITRQIELVPTPILKMSDQPKDYKIDSNQPLPPPPQPGGGGGGGTDKGKLMTPPPMLGAPASGIPAPVAPASQSPPPAPLMSPATVPAPEGGRTAPAANIPGCVPAAGAPGQYVCGSREAYAGCERLRASGTAGIRACNAIGEGRRR